MRGRAERAAFYIAEAAKIRALAASAESPEVKTEMLKIAVAFEQLAKELQRPKPYPTD